MAGRASAAGSVTLEELAISPIIPDEAGLSVKIGPSCAPGRKRKEWEISPEESDAFNAALHLEESRVKGSDPSLDTALLLEESRLKADADTVFQAFLDNGATRPKRFADGFRPRKLCRFFQLGGCTRGEACTFAHGEEELHPEAADVMGMDGASGAKSAVVGNTMVSYGGGGGDASRSGPPGPTALTGLAINVLQPTIKQADGFGGGHMGGKWPEIQTNAAQPQCISALRGPRTFPVGQEPPELCQFFAYHPTRCQHGDECPLAHGLQELEMGQQQLMEFMAQQQASSAAAAAAAAAKAPFRFGGGHGAAPRRGALPAGVEGSFGRFGNGSSFLPRKLCNFWVKDPATCRKGNECSFAHGTHELHPEAAAAAALQLA